MNCKFCGAELAEEMTLCEACGKDNAEVMAAEEMTEEIAAEEMTEEIAAEIPEEELAQMAEEAGEEVVAEDAPAPKIKTPLWVRLLAIFGALALLVTLAGSIIYAVNRSPKAKSYTVSAEKADKVRDNVVATVGDYELTNNELQVFFWQGVEEFYSYYGYYLDASILDLEKPLDTQFYDEENGITWQMHFLDNALSTWSRYAALCMHAKEQGFDMSEATKAELEKIPQQLEDMAVAYNYESAAAMLTEDMGAICTADGYASFLTTNLFAGEYLDSIYDSLVPTDAEIEAYYVANEAMLLEQGISKDSGSTVDARHILIKPKGGTESEDGSIVYSDEEWEQCRADAQAILDQWLSEGGTEESFAQYASMYTEDTGSMTTGGLYTDIPVGKMIAPFEDWCFDESRQYGDYGLVQTTYGYHIMFFVESREIWATNVRDLMISDNSMAIVNEAAAKWTMDVNYDKIAIGERN